MRSLPFSKGLLPFFLCLVLGACTLPKNGGTPGALPRPYLFYNDGGLVYDAAFHYKDFHASGLLVVKRLKESAYHVVLLSKLGPRLMEFRLDEENIQWIRWFEALKKKRVERLLERDFRMLLLSMLDEPGNRKQVKKDGKLMIWKVAGKPAVKIQVDPGHHRVVYAENTGLINPVKTTVSFTYQGAEKIPGHIVLSHKNVNMGLDLTLLKTDHAER